jgi:hypothetical protein
MTCGGQENPQNDRVRLSGYGATSGSIITVSNSRKSADRWRRGGSKARVLLARDHDRSCSFRHVARHEVDKIEATGTMSF